MENKELRAILSVRSHTHLDIWGRIVDILLYLDGCMALQPILILSKKIAHEHIHEWLAVKA